ncbi:MAG: alpha-N-acetylglucosaminidase [bacterium]
MKKRILFGLFAALVILSFAVSGKAVAANNDSAQIIAAARNLLQRVVPAQAANFEFRVMPADNGLDVFEIDNGTNGPVISGNSVSALTTGINWYLKYSANASVSWTGDQLNLPTPLPKVKEKIHISSPYKYRYIYNYCTFNYTMSFWDWKQWERELDFLALNGVNLALSIVGQEAVWQNFMRRMGFSEEEIFAFIPGPAYQAWWLMGNLEGWGGPVSQQWIDNRRDLQRKILARMNELGMEPVLQGFYGMFPLAGIKRFQEGKIYETGIWGGFERPAMVDPLDPFFDKAAAAWYEEQAKLYGNAKFFGGDPFHEGGKADIDLTKAGARIQAAMLKSQPGSSWVLQGWQSNPRKELLDGTIKENTLIVDLFDENSPQWNWREGFYGHPWVWNIISNFGGNTGLHGAMKVVAKDPVEALKSPIKGNLVGIGAMMEGSMQDAPLWDLLYEMGWRTEPVDLDQWIPQFVTRRYGKTTPNILEAWKIMQQTVYAVSGKHFEAESPMCMRPSINPEKAYGEMTREYNWCALSKAWELFMADADQYRGIPTFEHDLVNLARQNLSNLGLSYGQSFFKVLKPGKKDQYIAATNAYLQLILDQDKMLQTEQDYMLGKWIADARSIGTTEAEKDLFEWNARTQLTVWGTERSAAGLHEYAQKEWSGSLGSLYYQRWKMFFDKILENFDVNAKKIRAQNQAVADLRHELGSGADRLLGVDPTGINWYKVENEWTRSKDSFPSTPQGNPIDAARANYDKYYPDIKGRCGM